MANNKSVIKRGFDEGITFTEPSLTLQSELYDSDVNNIMCDGYVCGVGKTLNRRGQAHFGDFTSFSHDKMIENLNYTKKAISMFNDLPSDIRSRFDNDPCKLIQFVENPSNYDEAVRLGICSERSVSQPVQVEVVTSNDKVTSPSGEGSSG